jgi:diaminohydroxyphosphoribosylaminopyrimidine deaminase/5-amino-6-(5-phosphoribosylamino)uracil reductase
MTAQSSDEELLQKAHALAREGVGLASPGPHVGAVIADMNGKIVGSGTYTYESLKHAEILALEAAGNRAQGGTLYINLEPHGHQGRTAPCTDALIAAGIRRVVASMADPNPKVSGRGFEQLRAAGVQVEVGLLEDEARRLNEGFAHYIRHGTPLVTLKSAMTLDGKIAPASRESGAPYWITGEVARTHVQEQRHQHDAVLTGIGTILADDPLLTDRSGRPRRRSLLRVILDSRLRLRLESNLVRSAAEAGKNDVLVFCIASMTADASKKRKELETRGIGVEQIPANADGRVDFIRVLRRLGQLEITTVMIEAGSLVNAAALSCDAVDKVFLYYAPVIFGDGASAPFASSDFQGPLREARNIRMHQFGLDVAIEGYLRDPYRE